MKNQKFVTPLAVATEYLNNAQKQFNELVKGEKATFDFKEFATSYKVEMQVPTFAEISEPANYPTYEQVVSDVNQFNQVAVDTVQAYNQFLVKQGTQMAENMKTVKNPFADLFKTNNN